MRLLDLHAHLPMRLGLPALPHDNPAGDAARAMLLRLASVFLNNRAGRYRATPEAMREGCVAAAGSVLYNPADEFRLGHEAPPCAFPHILRQIEMVEEDARDRGLAVARNPRQLAVFIDGGRPVLFHCVEGALALGGDAANVARLARRGVAYMTIAHLFYKGAATCANAIQFLDESAFARLNGQPDDLGLTHHGEDVVEAMLREGMIVDIAHATDRAIDDIFRVHASQSEYRARPIISSHTGLRAIAGYPLNLSAENVRRIARTNGVVGVILASHWLLPPGRNGAANLAPVLRAIDCLYRLNGSHAHTAIGSDLDGFIEPIGEIETMADLPLLADAVTREFGAAAAEAILYGNALRVLGQGWHGV